LVDCKLFPVHAISSYYTPSSLPIHNLRENQLIHVTSIKPTRLCSNSWWCDVIRPECLFPVYRQISCVMQVSQGRN